MQDINDFATSTLVFRPTVSPMDLIGLHDDPVLSGSEFVFQHSSEVVDPESSLYRCPKAVVELRLRVEERMSTTTVAGISITECQTSSARSTVFTDDLHHFMRPHTARRAVRELLSKIPPLDQPLSPRFQARLLHYLSDYIGRIAEYVEACEELVQEVRFNFGVLFMQTHQDTVAVSSSAGDDDDDDDDGEKRCAVCLDELMIEEIVQLPCSHVFHSTCIDRWLLTADKKTCPVCRNSMLDGRNNFVPLYEPVCPVLEPYCSYYCC